MAVAIRTIESPIEVDGDAITINHLRLIDPDLIQLVQEADEPVQIVTSCITVGARVLRTSQMTVDTTVVETRFAQLEQRVEEGVGKAVELIAETAEKYLDPERGALRGMLDELEKSLGDAFDSKSKASVLAKFEGLLTGGTADMKKVVRDMVDPGKADSPLGRLRTEIASELKDVRQAVEQVKTHLAAQQVGADVLELTAIKGRRFEETVFEAAAGFVSLFGDEPELVGDANGVDGARCGDIVVAINEAHVPGGRARYVIEVKDRKLTLKDAMRELDKAMENRDASAGVIVFSALAKAPISTPFQLFGNRAIVVLEKDNPDPRSLQLALAAVRCLVQLRLDGASKDADLDGVLELVDQAQRALSCHATIRRCHATAQNQITSAAGQVQVLVEQLDVILGQIAGKLRG